MNKKQAMELINRNAGSEKLTLQNTHWANISNYGNKEGWWLNIPFEKFSDELFLILNNKKSGQFLNIQIPGNSIQDPVSVFRSKGKTSDIFIETTDTNTFRGNEKLIDTQSNSTNHNFSIYTLKLFENDSFTLIGDQLFPDEIENTLKEGSKKKILVNSYERNLQARDKCIAKYGYSCAVCSFSFETFYGIRGAAFIHVHHLIALSNIGDEYIIDPIKDLRPVCPNCHAMLHRKGNISIDELKNEIKKTKCKIEPAL